MIRGIGLADFNRNVGARVTFFWKVFARVHTRGSCVEHGLHTPPTLFRVPRPDLVWRDPSARRHARLLQHHRPVPDVHACPNDAAPANFTSCPYACLLKPQFSRAEDVAKHIVSIYNSLQGQRGLL